MVFEAIGTMINNINFFGTGVYLFVAALIFAISRGLTTNTESIMMYVITIGVFFMITLFTEQAAELLISLSIISIIYAFVYFKTKVHNNTT